MMFDFKEIEEKNIRDLENRINELDNQVKYWRSMYEKEKKKRPIQIKYVNDGQEHKRTKEVLKLHHNTRSKLMKESLIKELYVNYGVTKEPTIEDEVIDLFGIWK